jgi:hypothetical protein
MRKKVYAVVGAPLTGKTTYIKNNFSDSSKYYWADVIESSKKVFGEVLIEDDDKLSEIYNDVNQGMVDHFFLGDKDVVFEYCTGFEETDGMLLELIDQIKSLDVEFELIQLDSDLEEAEKRNEQVRSEEDYYSSYFTGIDTQVVLAGFFEDYATNTANWTA